MNACVKTGAIVHEVPHGLVFAADLFQVGTAMVVRANGPIVAGGNARRIADCVGSQAFAITHELHDDRGTGFWRGDLGIFVVPADRLTEVPS